MNDGEAVAATHLQELRRGTVVMAVLAVLQAPGYGYALLEELNEAGVGVEANTLYPLLRRLEKQGLLVAEWTTDEARPRKYYRASDEGRRVLDVMTREWRQISGDLMALIEKRAKS